MSTVYIGIGSNLGDRRGNCEKAMELLEKTGIIVKKRSSVYETEAWGVRDQPPYINMAVEIETELSPTQLLTALKAMEKEAGREKSSRWGPRVLDLDILLFEDVTVLDDDLKIPHPLMHEREFVLIPLDEIAPEANHPLLRKSVHELLQQLMRRTTGSHGVS